MLATGFSSGSENSGGGFRQCLRLDPSQKLLTRADEGKCQT